MNVDEAMRESAEYKKDRWRDSDSVPGMRYREIVAITLAAEVERLRAEVQRLDIAGTHTCHDDCPKLPCVQRREIERLRAELADTENARDSWRRVCEKETEAKHQAWAELAAAKAASVVPVKVDACAMIGVTDLGILVNVVVKGRW